MKYLILVLSLCLSSAIIAVEVNSIRSSNSFVEKGSTRAEMIKVLGEPESMHHHVINDRKGWPIAATSYSYTVYGQKYTVVVVDGRIYKIEWER